MPQNFNFWLINQHYRASPTFYISPYKYIHRHTVRSNIFIPERIFQYDEANLKTCIRKITLKIKDIASRNWKKRKNHWPGAKSFFLLCIRMKLYTRALFRRSSAYLPIAIRTNKNIEPYNLSSVKYSRVGTYRIACDEILLGIFYRLVKGESYSNN